MVLHTENLLLNFWYRHSWSLYCKEFAKATENILTFINTSSICIYIVFAKDPLEIHSNFNNNNNKTHYLIM